MFSQENLFFSEIESNFTSLNERFEQSETFFALRSDLFFDRPDLTIILSNQLDQYLDYYNTSNYSTAISLEKRVNNYSNNCSFHYQEFNVEKYKTIDLNNNFLWNEEDNSGINETGFSINWLKCVDQMDYNELSATIYFLRKKYYNSFTIHHKFSISTWRINYLNEASKLLPQIAFQINLAKPLTENAGLSVYLDLNYNFMNEDNIFIPNEDFYNAVSYNSQKFGFLLTYMRSICLFKPRFSLASRQYMLVAVEEEFTETEINSGLYSDFITPWNLLFYGDLDFSAINDDIGWNNIYIFSAGVKYQFDIYVR